MDNYLFPFQLVPQNSHIVLYGAGNVGKQFYHQITTTKYVEIVKWVDKNYKMCSGSGIPVSAVETINESEYDYIVLAIADSDIALSIRKFLKKEYGVEEERIIYHDSHIKETLIRYNIYEVQDSTDISSLRCIRPKELLNSNRLDLAVRYLVAKDMLNEVYNEDNLSLYSRMLLVRSNAYEGEHYFAEYKREGTKEYIASMKKLCASMKDKGFDKDKFIPIGDNKIFLNGAHRTAVALALDEDIWVKHLEGQNGATNFGIKWFEENGFSINDKIRILRAYADLYDKCGIMILFGPCMEQWNFLQSQLGKYMTVVGSVELDFSSNYIAYENLIHEIYSDPLWRNAYIDRKLDLLKMSPLKIKVLLVSDENHKNGDLYTVMNNVKLNLRDSMLFETDIAPIVMHGSDSYEEFLHLKQILLSVNNLKHLKMRVTRNYSEEFINNLDKLKAKLKEIGIDKSECMCPGSSGFEIFGLRKAGDLDVAFKSKNRKNYGCMTIHNWIENIDYIRTNSIQVSDNIIYLDDQIIDDDNLHYVFYGMKFVNMDLIAQKKAYSNREKDIRDVRLYELFRDYVSNFEEKSYLKKRIEDEFYKKR